MWLPATAGFWCPPACLLVEAGNISGVYSQRTLCPCTPSLCLFPAHHEWQFSCSQSIHISLAQSYLFRRQCVCLFHNVASWSLYCSLANKLASCLLPFLNPTKQTILVSCQCLQITVSPLPLPCCLCACSRRLAVASLAKILAKPVVLGGRARGLGVPF